MSDAPKNIALLIDADNASHNSLDDVLTVLAELGAVNIRRAYGNWSKHALKGWAAATQTHAIEPQQQFDLTKGKNATDMKMTIDAMDLLANGRVEGFGIMSSDSDFTPIAMRLRQNGLPVYGFGTSKTPEAFQKACTRFIDVGALSEPASTIAQPVPTPERSQVDPQVLDLLGKAWKAAKRDEKGFAKLAEVGQLAGNQSSFDARSYGYSRLSDLIANVPEFTSEKRTDGMWVKRVR
ncbi:MAG: NYN domain-containing protein [Sphingomonadales bacterium]